MSIRDDLHRLVDQLDETALPDAARQRGELHQRNRASATKADTQAAITELRRRQPWIGSLHSGRGDLAERSAQILCEEFGIERERGPRAEVMFLTSLADGEFELIHPTADDLRRMADLVTT